MPKPVHDVSDSVILLQASFGHEMAGILYSSHVCAVSKWACFPTHTPNHAMSHLLCLKNVLLVLNYFLYHLEDGPSLSRGFVFLAPPFVGLWYCTSLFPCSQRAENRSICYVGGLDRNQSDLVSLSRSV